MAEVGPIGPAGEVAPSFNIFYRILRLFADIRRGEAAKALLLAANVFLILMAYFILKPLREALFLVDKDSQVI
jgi:AAA family ATP:ADP antiporter